MRWGIVLGFLAVAAPAGAAPKKNTAFQAHSKGVEFVARGKCREALPHFEEANRINPGFSPAWLERGRCLMLGGDRARAIAVLSQGIEKSARKEDRARLSREIHSLGEFFFTNETFQKCQDGLNLLRKGMAEEAVDALEEALDKEPDNTLVLTSLGRARILAAMRDKAREPLERALQLNPDRVDAKELLGQLLWDKEPARVLDLLEPLSRKRDAGEDTVLFTALAMAQMKRVRDATALLHGHVEERGDWL
ncbi:MAG: tetratricopeptide repeat protein, partial [Bdellovibrionales bacterium]|nr:tetratricopeptide repeat protein [Bdellovibrionales bacterium]